MRIVSFFSSAPRYCADQLACQETPGSLERRRSQARRARRQSSHMSRIEPKSKGKKAPTVESPTQAKAPCLLVYLNLLRLPFGVSTMMLTRPGSTLAPG